MYNDFFVKKCKNIPLATSLTTVEDTMPHIHSEFEMVCVVKGRAEVRIGADSFVAEEGDLIFSNPMEVHSVIVDKSSNYLHRCICFDVSLIPDECVKNCLSDGTMCVEHVIKSNNPASKNAIVYFEKLFEAAEKEGKALSFEASAYISLIFAEIIKWNMIFETAHLDKQSVFCSKMINYIAENYSKDISSADPAKEFFYTQSHFCRTFMHSFGTPFSVFLNMYRVSRAKELLENPEIKISDVAQRCGFSNLSYFSKTFKKIVGLSPVDYKKYQYTTKKSSKE